MRFVVREIVIDSEEETIAQEIYRQELLIEAPNFVVLNDGGGASLTHDLIDYLLDQASDITGWCIVSCTIEEHTNDDGYPAE